MLTPETAIIFLLCLAGCTYHSFVLGRKRGIEGAVQYFIDEGVIEEVE